MQGMLSKYVNVSWGKAMLWKYDVDVVYMWCKLSMWIWTLKIIIWKTCMKGLVTHVYESVYEPYGSMFTHDEVLGKNHVMMLWS